MLRHLLAGALIFALAEHAVAGGKPGRHAGRIHSVTPHEGILTIEECGARR